MTQDDLQAWLDEAWSDFDAGKILQKAKKYNFSVFHFVQAAEKAIKSLLHFFNAIQLPNC